MLPVTPGLNSLPELHNQNQPQQTSQFQLWQYLHSEYLTELMLSNIRYLDHFSQAKGRCRSVICFVPPSLKQCFNESPRQTLTFLTRYCIFQKQGAKKLFSFVSALNHLILSDSG